jgi:hypothetical protein
VEGWREDKNACMIRAFRIISVDDPQPEPHESFCDPKHMAKIAEIEALSVAAVLPKDLTVNAADNETPLSSPAPVAWLPKRLIRTVFSAV